MQRYKWIASVGLLLLACSSSRATRCTEGAHMCACYGNATCDKSLTCIQPENVCLTQQEAADGGYATWLLPQRAADSGTDSNHDADLTSVDAGNIDLDDAASAQDATTGVDAATKTTTVDFVGKWSCVVTQLTDTTGNKISNPISDTRTLEISDSYYVTDNTLPGAPITYAFARFDGDVLCTVSTPNGYKLTLHDAHSCDGWYVNAVYPKWSNMVSCTK